MGDPKKQKKKYEAPRFPWRTDALESELRLLGEYGLRNKRELWRHRAMLSKFRGMARSLLSMSTAERAELEAQLLGRLKHLGILHEGAVLDNVLDLAMESVLERRLQTLVLKRGLAKTVYQARQLITHGHISIGGRKVFSPSYLVPGAEEEKISYMSTSPLANTEHPLRESIEPEVSGGDTDE
ncbi:MAG: 30S ribosomal protein S4 [Candidatus Bathyarchaeota archaeon]|nr:30S ribosomal protein S4 [Candidatus Bathyarchaeota archaeon]